MKVFNNIKLSEIFYVSFLILFYWITINVSLFSYENFKFTSDGFHFYSTIRNITNGLGPFEGPTQQYILGRHAYLIFFLITPLVLIFKSPIVLLIMSITVIFISSYLIFKISTKIFGKLDSKKTKSVIIAVSYFFYPIVFKAYFFDPYFFQPDTITVPLFLYLFYSILNNSLFKVYLASILIILVKEEFILILPALILFSLILQKLCNLEGIAWKTKNFFVFFLIYIVTSFISISTLLYYRDQNTYNYLPSFFNLDILDLAKIGEILFVSLKLLAPLLPLFILFTIFYKHKKFFLLIIWILLISSVILRVFENTIVYGVANGSAWGNHILAPIIFIIFIITIKEMWLEDLKKKLIIFTLGIFFMISISLANNVLSKQNTLNHFVSYFKNENSNKLISEIKIISKKVKYKNQKEYIIVPEFFMYPFMKMSHASIGFLEDPNQMVNGNSKKEIIKGARYVLINKNTVPSNEYLDLTQFNKKKIIETSNFILFE